MTITIMADEEKYTNRQVERMLDEQSRDIKEHITIVTSPILDEVKKTNGRVTLLESQVSSQRNWRTGMTWGGAVVFFFLTTFILPVLTWNLLQTIQLKESIGIEVQDAIDQAFEERLQALEISQ